VKKIFTDPAVAARLAAKNLAFSSANSINWGRLAPQIVYYISAYCDLVAVGDIAQGEKINICVPTGNFGNILAAYYASRMGLPVNRFLCASNENKVLTDFLRTGIYDRRRELVLTSSPSMDILISSNLERLLFDLCDRDDATVKALMAALSDKGVYTAPDLVRERLREQFWGGFCNEKQVAATIRRAYEENAYLMDTHTAVALRVYEDYVTETGDNTKTISASTANPFKFAGSIYAALTGESGDTDEFAQIDKLAELTGQQVPPAIASLRGKEVRFQDVGEKEAMLSAVEKLLRL
jgi:threonine synthase